MAHVRARARARARRRCSGPDGARCVELAEAHLDWPMPGYTHLQRAQPVYLSHHLLAYFWKFRRDAPALRLLPDGATETCRSGPARSPASTSRPTAMFVAQELGFARSPRTRSTPSRTATSCSTTCAAAATCATHLSQLGAEIVLWSSEEFGFCERRRRVRLRLEPHAAEEEPRRRRAAAREGAARGRLTWSALHGVLHGAAADLQQGPPGGQGAAVRRRRHARARARARRAGCSTGIAFNRERLAAAAADELLAATDIADLLVRAGVPFREAHGVVGGLVRAALERGSGCPSSAAEELAELAPAARRRVLRAAARGRLARVEGLGGRHGAGARARAARAGAATSWREAPAVSHGVDFYARSVHEVARDLVGCVVRHGETRRADRRGRELPPGRARLPRVRRAHARAPSVLFGPPGHAYVYRSYGIHALLNAVCEEEGVGAAVLIRALEPLDGHRPDARAARPGATPSDLCSGPGKLTQALGIGLELNGSSTARRSRSSSRRPAGRRARPRSSRASGSASPRRSSCPGASATRTAAPSRARWPPACAAWRWPGGCGWPAGAAGAAGCRRRRRRSDGGGAGPPAVLRGRRCAGSAGCRRLGAGVLLRRPACRRPGRPAAGLRLPGRRRLRRGGRRRRWAPGPVGGAHRRRGPGAPVARVARSRMLDPAGHEVVPDLGREGAAGDRAAVVLGLHRLRACPGSRPRPRPSASLLKPTNQASP